MPRTAQNCPFTPLLRRMSRIATFADFGQNGRLVLPGDGVLAVFQQDSSSTNSETGDSAIISRPETP